MIGGRSRLKKRVCLNVYGREISRIEWVGRRLTHQHLLDHVSRCQPNDESDEHPGEYRYQGFMDHADAFDLEVIRCPEGDDEEKADEEERPG